MQVQQFLLATPLCSQSTLTVAPTHHFTNLSIYPLLHTLESHFAGTSRLDPRHLPTALPSMHLGVFAIAWEQAGEELRGCLCPQTVTADDRLTSL